MTAQMLFDVVRLWSAIKHSIDTSSVQNVVPLRVVMTTRAAQHRSLLDQVFVGTTNSLLRRCFVVVYYYYYYFIIIIIRNICGYYY